MLNYSESVSSIFDNEMWDGLTESLDIKKLSLSENSVSETLAHQSKFIIVNNQLYFNSSAESHRTAKKLQQAGNQECPKI